MWTAITAAGTVPRFSDPAPRLWHELTPSRSALAVPRDESARRHEIEASAAVAHGRFAAQAVGHQAELGHYAVVSHGKLWLPASTSTAAAASASPTSAPTPCGVGPGRADQHTHDATRNGDRCQRLGLVVGWVAACGWHSRQPSDRSCPSRPPSALPSPPRATHRDGALPVGGAELGVLSARRSTPGDLGPAFPRRPRAPFGRQANPAVARHRERSAAVAPRPDRCCPPDRPEWGRPMLTGRWPRFT